MLQETNLDKALKMVLAGKPVLAAVKKTGASAKYTFRSLNEILEKYIFLIQVPAVEDPEFKEKVTEMIQSPAINIVESPEKKQTDKPNKIVHCEERGYSGFLHIRCKCGAEKSFFTKVGLNFYKCAECGAKTELKDLKLAFLRCECGGRIRYFTNETAEMFDLNCLDCGQPVAMKYNEKKKLYETIRE